MHHFSQELEALTSQQNGLDGTTYSIANGKSFPVKSSSTISPTPNNMKTSKTLTQLSIEDELMSSAEDSPANRLASQENERDHKTNATFGRRCLELSESVNPVGSWARTFAGLLVGRTDWFSKRCSLTWKLSGTPSNRLLFQLAPQAHRTDATEFGLLPTPMSQAREATLEQTEKRQKKYGGKRRGLYLQNFAAMGMLPTPTAQQERANASIDRGKGNLSDEVATQFKDRWENFPTVAPICGGDDGLPKKLDGITFPKWRRESIKAYGNAIVPQVAHRIFKSISDHESSTQSTTTRKEFHPDNR